MTTKAKEKDSKDDRVFVIYGMPGSQYTAKVLCALDARQIRHYVVFADMNPTRRRLPSGGTMVPELQVLNDKTNKQSVAIVPDSENILHWFQDNCDGISFSPTPETSVVSERASNGVLAGAVLYYNWVDEEGYQRSMRKSLGKQLPGFVVFFRNEIIDYFASDGRASYRRKAAKLLKYDLNNKEQEEQFQNERTVHQMLIDELLYFQSVLDDNHNYMLSQDQPTAADFSIYAQLERLVGDMGDVNVAPSLPQLLQEDVGLDRFWKWYSTMRQEHGIRFKGKRPDFDLY